MPEIGIGIVGGGYMGKAHAAAYSVVATLFDTALRPRLEMVCATSAAAAERYRDAYGFARGTDDWRMLVNDPKVEAVIIASPQDTHRDIALAAFGLGKPVFCEKPLAETPEAAREMVTAAARAGVANMIGFNYVRTPATQFARQLLAEGRIGTVTSFRGEMTEDFLADPDAPASWRTSGDANGCMGDLAPHPINCAHALMGPIARLHAVVETVHATRGGVAVTNDDQAHLQLEFASGVCGSMFISRVATGRKMGYAYDIYGTHGAIRFDGEDQNALWLYTTDMPEAERGFRKILTGPAHPDYLPFCQGPGHGTGYQDQIIIEAKDFLTAIHSGTPVWPTFEEGLAVNQVVAAALASSSAGAWVSVADF
ncbi:Gfo/Idh/MocA family oxidoreductase [uncultured Tateyamaria sp.]|uniref:Gfo/Idh/MocA family protein n=1 Tax=uncultured Tateyamaria sp. TaxID=455651 RepID=UPI00262D7FBC|nr:Gfo/Idh/MocA family oxidoreductase [uncultured Tateyamaria sp.]